jgi:3D (Asp-Asp-Asp) domain-containing protein
MTEGLMTRTATGAVLAACVATVSVASIGFGSATFAGDAPPAPLGGEDHHRTAALQVAAGSFDRQLAWEHERRAEEQARQAAATRATPTRVRATATREAQPINLDGFLGTFEITCYSLQGTTASGRPVGEDVIAVDPRVIPLGTYVVIDGLGTKVAGDTGGNIKGNRLDIWLPSSDDCLRFGRQHRKVWRA